MNAYLRYYVMNTFCVSIDVACKLIRSDSLLHYWISFLDCFDWSSLVSHRRLLDTLGG
jgi:hypothetical protein